MTLKSILVCSFSITLALSYMTQAQDEGAWRGASSTLKKIAPKGTGKAKSTDTSPAKATTSPSSDAGDVTACGALEKWKTFGDLNVNVKHLFCGEIVEGRTGNVEAVKGGHHVEGKTCSNDKAADTPTKVCKFLKLQGVSRPYRDGDYNVEQVFVRQSKGKTSSWLKKADEDGGSEGSSMFPDTLTQKEVIDGILSGFKANKQQITALFEEGKGVQAACLTKTRTMPTDIKIVVRRAAARNPRGSKEELTGRYDLITAFPTKCRPGGKVPVFSPEDTQVAEDPKKARRRKG